MNCKNKPQIKLYKYENSTFVLQAIIDDFQDCSFAHNIYEAGQFTISINYNIPNALLFKKGLFVQFGDNPYDFGEIQSVQDSIGEDGKGSQIRNITGYDSRYILKRRVIRNTNSSGLWVMTAKGELCIRNLINDQCGTNAETKRQLPIINIIPEEENAIGNEYSVSEQFTNLYEVCKTIATQSEIGWRFRFENGSLTLEFFEGEDLSSLVQFSTDFDSLSNGDFTDSSDTFSNTIYVGGKGQNDERDIYEGENLIEGESPSGLDRFESWDNQSSMTTESEYENEAKSKLIQYGQNITINGNGLVKSPYVFREQYNEGDFITIAFSGQKAVVQILAIEEHWSWGTYSINFQFGKPKNSLNDQLQLILRQIQKASEKSSSTDSVKWFTIPTDTEMSSSDVTYNTIGFIGACAENGSTFKLYLDNEKTGAKTYHVYFKQLSGGKITFTTGKSGASNLTLNSGTYVAIIYVDENGNVTTQCSTPTNQIETGNTQPITSDAVSGAVTEINSDISDVNSEIDEINSDITDINSKIPSQASSQNQLATESSVSNAINALDVSSVGGSGKYISEISETNGKISATAENLSEASVGSADKLNIETTNTSSSYPLLFTENTTAGKKKVYTDTSNNIAYNPSTDTLNVNGNVNASNLPYMNSVYSGSTYSSGYFLLAQLNGSASTGNHDISLKGQVIKDAGGITSISDFYIYVRGSNATVSRTSFVVNSVQGNVPLVATYEVLDTNKYRINLYGQITSKYNRFNTKITFASNGDVSPRTSNRNVTFPNSYASSVSGTQITSTSSYAGGTKVTLNGSDKGGSSASFYAPTSAGTSGQLLKSNGSGAPSWVSMSVQILDLVYPVGSIYMSVNNVSPQTFLGGTWSAITGGYFLRASGGNAGTVGEVQEEGLPNIEGSMQVVYFHKGSVTYSGALSGTNGNGIIARNKSHTDEVWSPQNVSFNAQDGNATIPDGASDTSKRIYGNSNHVTPVNMAVYMWKRTA